MLSAREFSRRLSVSAKDDFGEKVKLKAGLRSYRKRLGAIPVFSYVTGQARGGCGDLRYRNGRSVPVAHSRGAG